MANPYFTGKHQSLDSPEFRAHVVEMGCVLSDLDCEGVVQPHHETPVGRGGSDVQCIPLCNHHHRLREKLGWPKFSALYKLDLSDVHRRVWDAFLLRTQAGAPPLLTAQKKKRAKGSNLQPLNKTCNTF